MYLKKRKNEKKVEGIIKIFKKNLFLIFIKGFNFLILYN